MYQVQVADSEIKQIQKLTKEIASCYDSVEDTDFLRNAPTYAQELPHQLRASLNAFKLLEPSGICLISSYPIDNAKIGKTPAHWQEKIIPSPAYEEEIYFFLCGCLLGNPIGWSTQQHGYILHDILPIKDHENEQLGSGSKQTLTWHIEDAFHPYRGDYIGLMCMRNPDNVETTFASIDSVKLDEDLVQVLFQQRFVIRPDESHLEKNRFATQSQIEGLDDLLKRSYAWIEQMNTDPEKVAVLFGDPHSPYVRVDPYFMDRLDDEEAQCALNKLIEAIDEKLVGVALQPGQICFIDNYKVVHGRNPFKARYDGTDRWLKRLNITGDLRKSRAVRLKPESRIIF